MASNRCSSVKISVQLVRRLCGSGRARSNAYIRETGAVDVGADIFQRGLCLPSDNKMTAEEQEIIIRIIHQCFN